MSALLPYSRFGRFMLSARGTTFRLIRSHGIAVDAEVKEPSRRVST